MGEIMNSEKRICLNQSVLDFMAGVLERRTDPLVLELGSGWSSAWFAARCGQLVTVETSHKWGRLVEKDLNDAGFTNWQMYKGEIPPDSLFLDGAEADLVLVDCREDLRLAATKLGWALLKPGGWILFDDAQRPRHFPATRWLTGRAGAPKRLEWSPGDIETAVERLALAWQKAPT